MKTSFQISMLLLVSLISSCSAVNRDEAELVKNDNAKTPALIFHKTTEPNEQAFTFLLPENWSISGGITRVDPNTAGGSGNAIEAKLYMKISSADNKAEMGWLPDTRFFDMRRYPGTNSAASMFPDGSNYNGMLVMKFPSPEDFAIRVAVPFAHPHAIDLLIVSVNPLAGLAAEYSSLSAKLLKGSISSYQASITTLEYSENGIQYLEKMIVMIEDYGKTGAGLWGNKETWYVRAEKKEFNLLAPIFATIGQSVRLNPDWISKEFLSQQMNSNIALQTQQAVEQIEREITENRARTNSEINNAMYLNITGQEDFTNPFTGEIERGTNEWNYRWENEQGDIVFSDNQNYQPNEDVNIHIKGFKRSESRKK
ncbi:MAG: hypothetical protein HXX13_10865 [Bacteroidetes bacterium]|nr:hypothetical protein [Bacteroidota bacterium]